MVSLTCFYPAVNATKKITNFIRKRLALKPSAGTSTAPTRIVSQKKGTSSAMPTIIRISTTYVFVAANSFLKNILDSN